MFYRVRYLPLGVKNVQQTMVYIPLRDYSDRGILEVAKVLGCLETDIESVEAVV